VSDLIAAQESRYRILVVEDDPEFAEIFQDWLLSVGHISTVAQNFDEAKKALRYYAPHAIVLDLGLPEVEQGFEIAKLALRRSVPVVIVTAFPSYSNARLAFKRYRVVDFLPKQSISRETLIAAIHSSIHQFNQLATEAEKGVLARDAEQSVDLLAHVVHDFEHARDELLTTTVHFFPDQTLFLGSRSALQAGYGELVPPFMGQATTVLRFLDLSTIDDFDENEIAFLDSEGFRFPLSEKALRTVGQELYHLLVNPHPESSTTSTDLELLLAKHERGPERLHLCFSEQAISLASYPWELLHDERRFLAQNRTRITRSIVYGENVGEFGLEWPVRILIVAPRPVDGQKLSQEEQEAVQAMIATLNASSKYDIVRVPSPVTYAHVASELLRARDKKPFDILYFDGHGEFGWQCDCGDINPSARVRCGNKQCNADFSEHPENRPMDRGFLFFEQGSKTHSALDTYRSVSVFGDSGLKMVILSACNSAMIGGASIFNSVGLKLLETGIPAVIGMQFPVGVKDTTAFFREVFGSLTEKECITTASVETAIRDARRQILSNWWFCPVLYLRAQHST
jgi:CheY-like chemotaxis protein